MKNAQQKTDLENRIDRARLAGAMRDYTPDEFKNYLLNIGLTKYEKTVLSEEFAHGAKIIPFPGVTLPTPEVTYQNALDGFLREMGYIG